MPWPHRFCSSCGHPLGDAQGADRQHCAVCDTIHYRNAKPCAGVLITRGRTLLLARRAVEPKRGEWDVVGGFVHPHEHPTDAARREALEETGLHVTLGSVVGMYVDRYGEAPGSDFTLNIYYLAEAPDGTPVATSDVSELRWFDADALPETLAFPHQGPLLRDWRMHLQGRA